MYMLLHRSYHGRHSVSFLFDRRVLTSASPKILDRHPINAKLVVKDTKPDTGTGKIIADRSLQTSQFRTRDRISAGDDR